MAGYRPKGPNEDGITFLPLDRSGASDKKFGPTDPRNQTGLGGMRLGVTKTFALEEDMPRLAAEQVAQACDNIVRGKEAYSGILYLSRARVEDIPALLTASMSREIRVRWERLWVLTPFMSRLSRSEEGRQALLDGLSEDLGGVHLLSKFAEQNNPAIKRMFARLHDPLLAFLMARLVEFRFDARRAALISAIVGTLEHREDVLRQAIGPDVDPEHAQEALSLLYMRHTQDFGSRLSSGVLRDKLVGWRRD